MDVRRRSRTATFVRAVAGVAGGVTAVAGFWAFFAPVSFYETLATFPPYNAHFLRDLGAFQIGLGAVLLLALRFERALTATLGGFAVGSAFHVASHVLDWDLSDQPVFDVVALSILTLLVASAAWLSADKR